MVFQLKELTEKITKGTTPSNIGADFTDDGIMYFRSELIGKGKYIDKSSGLLFISKETHDKLKRSQIKENDILFSMAGVYLGKVSIAGAADVPANTNQAVAIIRFKKNVCNVEYVYYYMKQKWFNDYVCAFSSQAAQPNINLNQIGKLKIDLPNIEKQDKVVNIISKYDTLIENNNKRIKILEQMAENLYKEWFVRFRFPGYETTEFVGGVPKGWECCKLEDFIEFNPQYKIKKGNKHTDIPMTALNTEGMSINESQMTIGISYSGSRFINGDVLFAKMTPCLENGKTGLVTCLKDDEVGSGSTEFIVMHGCNVSPFFTYCIARSDLFRNQAINSMNGADGRQRADLSFIKNLKWILPSENELKKFDSITYDIIQQINAINKQNANLIKQRDLLLPRLMSGKLQLK